MKKLILLVVLAALMVTAKSYSQDSTKQLLNLPKIKNIGFYIAPEYQYGQLKDKFTSFAGVSGMILFNKTFGIGGEYQHNTYDNYSPSGISPLLLRGDFGGLKMEYIIKPNSAIHYSFNLLVGGGSASADSAATYRKLYNDSIRNDHHRFDHKSGIRSDYFIIQPGVQIEANLIRCLKLFAGVNYRFSIDGDHINSLLPSSTLQGLSVSAGIKIGLFDYKIKKNNP
ncbi:MAG: hypothetical protein Q8880_11445 [Bacteroidota bacterium]|nr:hypothetical protein [Bacteroidota bacterium]